MGRRKPRRRVEPTFERAQKPRGRSLSASEDDRVVPSRRKSRKKSASGSKSRRRGGRRRGLIGLLGRGVYWSFVLAIWAGIGVAGLVAYYGAQMPSATTWAIPDRPPNVKIVAVDGELLANRGMTGGEAVGLHEMSPFIPAAVIAIEDRRFRDHFGVDPFGLARAMLANLLEGSVVQGGSTLTQQLAKNLFLEPERTVERKVQEVLLALWLEQTYDKDQILEMYLNRVYFGSGAYGVEAASRRYFNKSARDVTLAEAALLAGLLKAPSRLSPARDPKAAEARTRLVLQAMRQAGTIDDSEWTQAVNAPARRAPAFWTGSEHYAADRVMEDLPSLIGEVRSDVIVETTIDLTLQTFAEISIRNLIDEKGGELAVSQGALVSIDATGAIRAMVGGRDYASSQFDRVSEARRQPGSAFKPFVFLAAMEHGLTPDTIRTDKPIRIGKWTPGNYKDKFHGPVTLTEALAKSMNSVSAQLVLEVGPKAVVEAAHRLGIVSKLQANASIALGTSEVTPMELTAAYIPFANGGYRPDLHLVTRVTTPGGKVLYERGRGNLKRVLRPETVGMMNAMMRRTVESGTARKAAFGWPAAGKTGTSQNSRDAWFIGYTANLVTGVWFGNDDGSPTKSITGGTLPVQAWQEFMEAAHGGVPVADLPGGWNGRALTVSAGGGGTSGESAYRATGEAAVFQPQPGEATPSTTSSIAPRPRAGVGEPNGRDRSILDIIKDGAGLF
ncbi:MAG: penicillin-binding protein [Rhizobiaceae bacterium]|nr:penicillin-binding protein [Rhizobiaceae bacterium]MCV0406006.1 penicillin-binding protein [Rhizobiaceae bacterium]